MRASRFATLVTESSGTATRITSAAISNRVSLPKGRPAPMYRAAVRAVPSDRVTTDFMCHPASRNRRPNARPTRPAPTIASVVPPELKFAYPPEDTRIQHR